MFSLIFLLFVGQVDGTAVDDGSTMEEIATGVAVGAADGDL